MSETIDKTSGMAVAETGAPKSNVVVSDNGTGFVKLGFGGENFPRSVFQSMLGRPELRAEEADIKSNVVIKPLMVGDEASAARQFLKISYPIANGIVNNWADMEHLWDYSFRNKLNVAGDNPDEFDCSSNQILLTEAPLNPQENKEKMMQLMFEKYNFASMQLQTQAMLTLYAQGLLTGLVLDSGDGVSHVVAVYEGFVPAHLTQRLNVAGRHITTYMTKLLLLAGYPFNSTSDFETVREIKEELAYVALDIEKERKFAQETTVVIKNYRLPNGDTIKVGRERFECAEAMFNPALVDVATPGIADMIFDLIQAAEYDLRRDLYKHIVLSGGSTMYPGLPTRLEKDITKRYLNEVLEGNKRGLKKFKLRIEDPPRRKNLVFLGASVLGEIMEARSDFWVTKETFEEEGVKRAAKRVSALKS
jgi:actin-related protein 2